jgi:hypothetical protein
MQFDAGLSGDAASLARAHAGVLARLPATVHAFILVELQKWPALFPAEQRYQRALLEQLSRRPEAELQAAGAGIARVEAEAGTGRIGSRDPARFQDDAQARLRARRLLAPWREAVDRFFRTIDPAVEAQLFPADAPRRLIVQIYGREIAVQPDKVWGRFTDTGVRVPLDLQGLQGTAPFLRALFAASGPDGAGPDEAGPGLLAAARASSGLGPLDTWVVEAHEALHDLWGRDPAGNAAPTGLSYDRLRGYRDELMRALYKRIQSGVESPQAFAAYARSLKIAPGADAMFPASDLLPAFVREVLLTGNGTLFVNNTFVEWAAVQALRRAQPRILVTRFGVRDKLKPFSSLLLFSQPRATDAIPLIEDPVGSFVDVEQLSYYIWLNAEKNAAYRSRTLYLFLAEGIDEMLAIRSDAPAGKAARLPAATLHDVCQTMAGWLGTTVPGAPGRPIPELT